ncbi:MAG: SPOR domain-containing protein, partial [Succinivibrionaceae bacterium]|nr:SPOR domain-containing protein [Succinivibrionaceae bacterium]
ATPAPARPAAPATSSQPRVAAGQVVPFSGEAVPGSESEIDGKDSGHYTVQVLASYRRADVVQGSAGVSGRYWIYQTTYNGRPWYVLISGDYATAREAQASIASLPAELRAGGPFVQRFGTVKQRKAQR